MNLREYARDKPCQIRVVGVCNGDPQTTVLAHLRMAGISGMGTKAADILGAHACSACHDYVDGRTHVRSDPQTRRLLLLEGIARTQAALIKDGLLKW